MIIMFYAKTIVVAAGFRKVYWFTLVSQTSILVHKHIKLITFKFN